jgi:hypothetical protein
MEVQFRERAIGLCHTYLAIVSVQTLTLAFSDSVYSVPAR